MPRLSQSSEVREFHEEAALNENDCWVQVSLSHAARVSLEETSVRLVNMALTAGGHGRALRAFFHNAEIVLGNQLLDKQPSQRVKTGEMCSHRRVPVTSLAAKLRVFWIRRM